MGGELWLLITALFLPLPLLLRRAPPEQRLNHEDRDGLTGLLAGPGFEKACDLALEGSEERHVLTACFLLEIDRLSEVRGRYGDSAAEEVLKYSARRITSALRGNDSVARLGETRFAICLEPVRVLDLEICLQMASRLQTALEEPVPLQAVSILPQISVGFCLSSRLPQPSGRALCEAADLALLEARRAGPSSIRAYHAGLRHTALSRRRSEKEAGKSLERGQIHAWFQPQVSTDTGHITGFETLARWEHPKRGVMPPVEFLPILQQTGQLELLAGQMLSQALKALASWDTAGLAIPSIGVNFADVELRNPGLIDKICWELDRFEIAPNRLAVEVLETVVAGAPDDVVVRNVNGLAKLGCKIDLDDFGTGHASISSIRRLHVSRLKIDRSFVARLDQDLEQQRMVSAIITMAEQLQLDTLAEGVETQGEHAMLAQLGCGHVQGYGIARPMPFDQTVRWARDYLKQLEPVPRISRQKR